MGTTAMAVPHIRNATREDVPTILEFIKQLAIYEKALDQVQATEESLTNTLFENPYAYVVIAEVEKDDHCKKPIGFSLYYYAYSTWTSRPTLYLEDLYVMPEYRNKGVGKHLFKRLGEIAKEKECLRVEWSVLTWNSPSIGFYKNTLGAIMMDEWRTMRLDRAGIERLACLV